MVLLNLDTPQYWEAIQSKSVKSLNLFNFDMKKAVLNEPFKAASKTNNQYEKTLS